MNEQLQQAITKMIEKALSGLDAGAEFLAGEIPDVVMQLMLWNGVRSMLMCIFGILFIIAGAYIVKRYHKSVADSCSGGAEPLMLFTHAWPAIGLFFVNIEWLQILIAPKVWLIEYAASLVK